MRNSLKNDPDISLSSATGHETRSKHSYPHTKVWPGNSNLPLDSETGKKSASILFSDKNENQLYEGRKREGGVYGAGGERESVWTGADQNAEVALEAAGGWVELILDWQSRVAFIAIMLRN